MNARAVVFRQLFEHASSTYTYIIGCAASREAVIIDPVIETVERDVKYLKELNLKPVYAANTHVHADHVTGSGELKRHFAALRSVLARAGGGRADVQVEHGEVLRVGQLELEVRSTPGHTDGCVTYVLHSNEMAFTGDALLIRGCGRTDFQAGDPGLLYESVHSQILSLPKQYYLYPAHDYKGMTVTTVDEESKHNPRLTKSKEEFVKIMDNLGLSYPKQIDKSLPCNLVCGVYDLIDDKWTSEISKTYKPFQDRMGAK